MLIQCFGNDSRQGTYALFIFLSNKLNLRFGNFLRGRHFSLDPGYYVYIGSALGAKSSAMPVARRLLRHASRSNGKPPHEVRGHMIRYFKENKLAAADLRPPTGKKLHWHIDYLLDNLDTRIIKACIVRSPARLENALSDLALSLDETFVIAPKLGAGDTKNSSHLLGIKNIDTFLPAFEEKIPTLLSAHDNRVKCRTP
ncbi:MAG: DUF123 domain-containing protein [Chlorobiales bacterium]|nr:DUF123 domain-containing protein [Chlorobiales bacterium]